YEVDIAVELTATPDAGFQFSGWSGDLTGSTNPATLTMNANKSVTATFTAIPPAQHTLTVTTSGSGNVTLNPPGGTYEVDIAVELTATPDAGFQFSGWSGDLTGSTNPATLTMNANKNVTATFMTIPSSNPTNSPIVHEETQTGGSSSSMTVTTAGNLTGVSGDLYLAAISMQPRVNVLAVSGLGLNWTLVKKQCSGLNTIAVEVWMAQGIPQGGSNDAVTATLASAPSATVIAVSRYSGVVQPSGGMNPIGNVISGNTNGANTSAVCSGGVPSDAYAFNLTTTENNAVVYSAVAMKGRTHAPGVGFTERAEIKQVGGGLTSSVAVEDKIVAAAGTPQGGINGSFSGTADWAEVAVEIKPQTGGTAQQTIAHEETQTGGSSNSTTVMTAGNLTGASGDLYLAAISMQPRVNVLAVSGLGLNWTLVKKQCSGLNTTAVEVWMAQGIPQGGSNDAVTATLASAPSATVIAVSRYSGVVPPSGGMNPIGNVISGNTNGANTSAVCSGGVPSDAYAFNLTTTE
ncbi:MAG: InlB B-repeat-containing protein, partial [bacterium]